MKKRVSLLVASALALMLSFALVGCGGGEDYAANFQGTWKVCSIEGEDEGATDEDIAMLEDLGLIVLLNLNEDKSASLDVFGDIEEGTWEAKSATECSVTIDGDTITGTLADGKLTLADDYASMTFVKLEGAEAEAAAAASAAAAAEAEAAAAPPNDEVIVDENFAAVTLVDDEVCTITATGKMTDEWGDSGYVVDVVNKTDATIFVSFIPGSTVNGAQHDFWGSATVKPGETKTDAFLYSDGTEITSLEALVNVKGTIEVCDDATLDVLGSYEVELA